MKKLLLLFFALLMGVSGVWAETATWTSGVDFLSTTSTGNYTTGWFSMVMPASGTMTSLRINLGTGSPRTDAYLAISKDLKSETTGFSSGDFVAISSGVGATCGTTDYDVTMTFSSGDLVGGNTYYFYWVTESDGIYTTVQQRYCVGNLNIGVQMSIGAVGSTTAQATGYSPRFSCTMTLKENVYYRMRALYPDPLCYLYSNSSDENKIFKKYLTAAPTSLVTLPRYVWKTTLGANGINIQNVGNSHYIAKINGASAGQTYLSATAVGDAEQFTIVANNPDRNYNYSGYIALKSTTNDNSYLNCYTTNNDYVGSYTVQDNKSGQFMFQQVKVVTFSNAVAVNGGDAVSTIYVACDGSDSFTLPAGFTYTISGVEYNAIDAAATIAAAGSSDISVTVKIVENEKKYRLMQKWTSTTFYLYSNTSDGSNGNRLWKSSTAPTVTDANYIWEAQSSGDNWKFYNVGENRWIAKASSNSADGSGVNGLSATATDDAEPFVLMSANSCDYPPSDFATISYVALKASTKNTYLNSYNSGNKYVGWHNAVHAGYYFKFIPVKKVTFSTAVAVNGGSTVSTIYVACDGSDSFTLPTNYKYTIGATVYYAAEAAAAIAAAGSSDISVTVTSAAVTDLTNLSNDKVYVITNARATWQFTDNATSMSAISGAYDTSNEAQQIAIINKNSNYYLYSINIGGYLTASNTVTAEPSDAEQITITDVSATDASRPWLFSFKNVADKNINVGSSTDLLINSHSTPDLGNCNAIIEAAAFDPTDALAMFNEKDVTYTLQWSDGTSLSSLVPDVTVTVRQGAQAHYFLPSSFERLGVTFTYSPTTISNETTTVTVTATWNGPFLISPELNGENFADGTKWYTVAMSYDDRASNYIWKYKSDDGGKVQPLAVATDAYSEVTNERFFCFVGDPYNGFTIYNKAAGCGLALSSDGGNSALMSSTGSLYIPVASSANSNTGTYFCLNRKGSIKNLDYYKGNGKILAEWDNSTASNNTIWVVAPSSYPYNFLDQQELDAPYGAVGTKDGIAEDEYINAGGFKTYFAANPFDYATMAFRGVVDAILDKLANNSTISLGTGFYQIISANPAFETVTGTKRRMIFNGTAIGWSNNMDANNVNGIFKLSSMEGENNYSIYSGNGGNYLSNGGGVLGSETAVTITEAATGTAQYSFYLEAGYNNNHHYLHANGHNSGNGLSGSLTAWNAGVNSVSAWYIVRVSSIDLALNNGGDGNYYATLCLPFAVTLNGASAYTLTLNEGKTALDMSEAITEVPAGTPVLLVGTTTSAKANIASDAACVSAPLITTSLTGTYTGISSFDGATNYVLGTDDTKVGFFHWNGTALAANRAYLAGSSVSGVKGFYLNWGDEDAISSIVAESQSQKTIYNLAGQRVQKAQKGLYIINGKKVVIK